MEKSLTSGSTSYSMSRHHEAFEELVEEAEQELEDSLEKLVLYGSVTRGEETEASDIDVFAVVKDLEQKKWIQQREAEIGVEHGLMMSVIARTGERYEEKKDSFFIRNLIDEGEAYV